MTKVEILLPKFVVVADKSQINFDDFLTSLEGATATVKSVDDIGENDMILDIAPNSASELAEHILSANTILFNGPVGVFEVDKFSQGTQIITHKAVSQSTGFSIAGGGDTLAAIDKYGVADGVDYLSTGGGAFLEFVEGRDLPTTSSALSLLK